jgi:hypothetical protein
MDRWELVPRQGIRLGEVQVTLGTRRKEIRRRLAGSFPAPQTLRKGEDQYVSDTTLFLRYEKDSLKVIMFIDGQLTYEGLELRDTRWEVLAPALAQRGLTISDSPVHFVDGVDCPELGINIATQEEVGGDGDGIEWVSLWRD